MVDLLIKNGADVNLNISEYTPLQQSVVNGNVTIKIKVEKP